MHAFLITGSTQESRIQKANDLCHEWNVLPYDIYTIQIENEKQSISIAEVRLLTQYLTLSPRSSPYVAIIIHHAHLLTTEAQNALLKTLEEPPLYARILLEVDHEAMLVPTIVSRCQIIHLTSSFKLSDDDRKKMTDLLSLLHGKNKGACCQLTDNTVHSKEEGALLLQNLLLFFHEQLIAPSEKTISSTQKMIHAVQMAQKQLRANVNEKMVFDSLFFKITS